MTAFALSATGGLLELLDRELAPIVAASGQGVDSKVWDRALTGLARELLARPGKLFRARLVEESFALAGGASISPKIPLLVELLHAGSLIVDDIQDDSPTRRGGPALHTMCGMPLALNTGNWLYFAAFELAGRAGLSDAATLALYRSLSLVLFRCHQGQALDLAVDVSTVRQRELASLAEGAAALKTGALVGFAAELGAIAASAALPERAALESFGTELGVALQRLDDLGGLLSAERGQKGLEDLAGGRLTWVWGRMASRLDEIHFAGLQSRLRQARQERGGARRASLNALAVELASNVDDADRAVVSNGLRSALEGLERHFGDHPALARISDEVARLEASYD